MSAYTAAQLETKLHSYVEPDGNFMDALAEVLPRLYNLGCWPDLVYETSLDGLTGYVSLPADSASVLACTVNDNPRSVRSMWHDVRIVGRQAELSPYFGCVEDGYSPVLLEMKDVQDVDDEDDVVGVDSFKIVLSGTTTGVTFGDLVGELTIKGANVNGYQTTLTAQTGAGAFTYYVGNDITSIKSIEYSDITEALDLIDPNFDDKVIATIPVGSGVVRNRRFRVSDSYLTECTVHLLLKRSCPANIIESTVIHLGNINAIKHGLLGRIGENSADVERADYHWKTALQLLDEELDSVRGAAKPVLTINGWGGGNKPFNLY